MLWAPLRTVIKKKFCLNIIYVTLVVLVFYTVFGDIKELPKDGKPGSRRTLEIGSDTEVLIKQNQTEAHQMQQKSYAKHPGHVFVSDVCVVRSNDTATFTAENNGVTCHLQKKKLLVYNFHGKSGHMLNGGPELPKISTSRKPIPADFNQTNHIAIIAKSRYVNNMNHFWREFMLPMEHLLNNKMKHASQLPLLYFSAPPYNRCKLGIKEKDFRGIRIWLDSFLPLLKLKLSDQDEFDWYTFHSLPHGTCFSRALLVNTYRYTYGGASHLAKELRFKVNDAYTGDVQCTSKNQVILLHRSGAREIINSRELMEAANAMGYNMQVIAMEKYSLQEQLKLIHCTKILIGVQGAGLQWSMFLQKGAAMIEVAWPDYGWQFRYSTNEMTPMWSHIRTLHLKASEVKVNYEETVQSIYGELGLDHQSSKSLSKTISRYLVSPKRTLQSAIKDLVTVMVKASKVTKGHGEVTIHLERFSLFLGNCSNGSMRKVGAAIRGQVQQGHRTMGFTQLHNFIKRRTRGQVHRVIYMLLLSLIKSGKQNQAVINKDEFLNSLQRVLKLDLPAAPVENMDMLNPLIEDLADVVAPSSKENKDDDNEKTVVDSDDGVDDDEVEAVILD